MKKAAKLLLATLALAVFYGCAVTVPVKVATTGAKAGVKTAKAGVKTTAKVGAAVIPDGDKKKDEEK